MSGAVDRFIVRFAFICGAIILAAGIYYKINDLRSISRRSGGRSGRPGDVVIDGTGMIFCALLVLGFALWYRSLAKKKANHFRK